VHGRTACEKTAMLDRLAIPIIQAPMLGATTEAITIAV